MSRRKRTGITRHGSGWRVSVSRGHGVTPVRRMFPLDTDPRVMQDWREEEQARLRLERRARPPAGTFAADAKRYLAAVKAMPTFADRKREIALWVAVFGTRMRRDITAAEIRHQRDHWRTSPRSPTRAAPPSAATINKRLRALSNLWTVLDGRDAPNPVRQVPEFEPPAPKPRALAYAAIERVLEAMPDVTQSQKGQKRGSGSKSKARLRVLAYTGWSNAMLAALTRADVDFTRQLARLPPRHKGAGVEATVVPLTPQAVTALRAFDALNCWGPFSRRSLLYAWQRALKRCGLPPARVYDLRHSFGTHLLTVAKDIDAARDLMQHADIRTTRGYTSDSVSPRLRAAVDALGASLKS